MRIGVISDTHGYLDPRAAMALQGVARILHAGDIGSPAISISHSFCVNAVDRLDADRKAPIYTVFALHKLIAY